MQNKVHDKVRLNPRILKTTRLAMLQIMEQHGFVNYEQLFEYFINIEFARLQIERDKL